MLELKEKLTRKEAEANTAVQDLRIKIETINEEIIEEREKRWITVPPLRIVINFVFQLYLRRKIIVHFISYYFISIFFMYMKKKWKTYIFHITFSFSDKLEEFAISFSKEFSLSLIFSIKFIVDNKPKAL